MGSQAFRFDLWGFVTSLGSFKYRSKPLAELMTTYFQRYDAQQPAHRRADPGHARLRWEAVVLRA